MKISKQEADYGLGMAKSHCGKVFKDDKGYCEHYIGYLMSPTGQCAKVNGEVSAVYWCRLFSKAD